ncbi:MAG: hypothetical protein ACKO3B_12035 [Bacteroidota bacterium]
MKITKLLLATACSALLLTGCEDNSDSIGSNESQSLNAEGFTDAYYQDVDDLASTLSFTADNSFSGRSQGLDDRFCSAAKVTLKKKVSSDPDSLVVNFGSEGCTDNKGNKRTGTMTLIWAVDRKAGHTVILSDFFINGKKVEGTRTVTRTAVLPVTHTITLSGGKVTWPDGTFATREASHTRIWNRNAAAPNDDSMVIKQGGTASGVNRNGKNYVVEVISDITFKFGCNTGTRRILLPISGSKVMKVAEKTITIDYGNGTCDDKATVTVDGTSKEITLSRSDD